ncbi:autotransporter domain-containing protein, partial [Burkholderia multivorans]|uniref:autotransporter outer membrane beta-barrel domain-containing protein n=1 Tax=Burkholderia multivorans TaxID=87883 RepID=UPI000ABD3A75
AGATFDVSGATTPQTTGTLSGVAGSTVNLGSNNLTLGGTGNGTYGGTIAGTGGSLTLSGTGTETLTGTNTYTGGTNLTGGGTLIAGSSSALGTGALNTSGAGGTLAASTSGTTLGNAVNLGSGSTLTVGGTNSLGLSGPISGSGTLALTGPSTTTLSGANSYSGGTLVTGGGTLVAGTPTALGSGTLSVGGSGGTLGTSVAGTTLGNAVNLGTGSTLTVGGANNLGLSGPISGGGNLAVNGPSTTTLSGANTYTGNTTIGTGSTLAVGGNGSLSAASALTLAGNGATLDVGGATTPQTASALSGTAGSTVNLGGNTLTVAGPAGGVFGGTIAGSGGFAVQGGGTQTLTGANTYTGGTTIGSGSTLALSGAGSLAPTSPVTLAGSGATLNLAGSAAPQSIGALSGTTGSNVNLGSTPLTVNTAGTGTFAGTLSGTAPLTLAGTGAQVLSGTNTLSGPTNVTGGTLAVTGSLANSPVTVGNGATVTGTGTIGGLVVSGGGTASVLQLGQPLKVAGNATFQPGSTLQVGATPQQSGGLDVTGSAALNGGTVQVVAATGQYQPGKLYTIVNAGAGVQGQFSAVNSTYAFLTPTLQYDASRVLLSLAPNGTPFASVASTPDGQAAAGAVGTLGAGNPLFDTVLTADAPTASRAFAQLAGDLYPSTRSVLLSDSRYVRDAVLDRARLGSQPGGALCGCEAPVSADDHAASLDRRLAAENGCTPAKSFKPAVWGRIYGSHSRFDGDDVASIDRNLYGFIVGTDAEVSSHWRVGIAGGASRSLLNTDQNESAKVNGETIALYASGRYDAWNIRGGLAQSWYRVHSERNPSFGSFSDHDTASYDANATQVFTEIGYSTAIRNVALEPFVGLAYASVHTGGFNESGGAAALQGESRTSGLGFSTLGVRASTDLAVTTKGKVSAYGTVGWRHAFGNTQPGSTLSFASGGTPFNVVGVPVARDAAVLEVGVDAAVTKNLSVGLSYSGQVGGHVSDHALYGNLLWKF